MKDKTFSADVRNVIQSSQREARRLGHDQIEVGHLLLGIIAEPESAAADLLQKLGRDLSALRKAVEGTLQPRDRVAPVPGHMLLAKEAERVLQNTYEQADEMGREEIGTEHILLSLLHEQEKAVAHVMEQACGITYSRFVRKCRPVKGAV